ncbi:putative exported nuclease [Aliivibrio salmonicida LFI1238]|uniref:Exported nuclease n=2 Tax=Aliivibrio salmonicida TaxID=40269 RepID=B6EKG4_ALISL|nr:putative exported nuclease [Aliivibrio salmonicida LFI1238]
MESSEMKTTQLKTTLAAAVGLALSGSAYADVIISQYVEGGSYNKSLEISNTGDSSVSLAGYVLKSKYNGLNEWQKDLDLSAITLDAKSVYVISNSRASDAIKAVTNNIESIVNHNGDDTYMLFKDGIEHDRIGVDGDVDWGKDKSFVRSTLSPSTTFDPTMWLELPKDNIDGLGTYQEGITPPLPFACETDSGTTPTFTEINEIQGTGNKSPLITSGFISDDEYFVQGIVTARGDSLLKGFYLQGLNNDNDPNSSEGIFVSTGSAPSQEIQPGALVCVKAKVQEYYSQTQLKPDTNNVVVQGSQSPVDVTELVINENETLADALERHEGMHVKLTSHSDLRITRNFSFDYDSKRNNMVLSHGAPLYKPTQLFAAESTEAIQLAKENAKRQITIESDNKAANGKVPYFPEFASDIDQDGSADSYLRLGARIEGLEGVVAYSYGQYRLVASNTITQENIITKALNTDGSTLFNVERTDKPSIDDEDLTITSFNVLNYFTSVSINGDANPTGQNRGATTADEFAIQQAKILSALTAIDADIIGLMEIENNGFGENSAIHDLTAVLNAQFEDKEDHYKYVEIDAADKYQGEYLGSDAIMVALLYRPDKVRLEGDARVIKTPEQHVTANTVTRDNNGTIESNPAYDKYQRHSLVQEFIVKEAKEPLTVVVNHLKSKGSECIEQWQNFNEDSEAPDLQGNCNRFRVSAVKAIGDELSTVEGDILILGDMNAYGMEDPLLTLTDYSPDKYDRDIFTASYTTLGNDTAGNPIPYEETGSQIKKGYGYLNLNTLLHSTETFSYTYSGELGNLDHALANESLAKRVTQIEDWHINATESNLFEYSSKYTGDMAKYNDMYSASDHDPVVISLEYAGSLNLLALSSLFGFGYLRRKLNKDNK